MMGGRMMLRVVKPCRIYPGHYSAPIILPQFQDEWSCSTRFVYSSFFTNKIFLPFI